MPLEAETRLGVLEILAPLEKDGSSAVYDSGHAARPSAATVVVRA